ncbi:MAG: Hpt domain-containing protein [Acidobacteria bacterium]|nr:Hpt domain-containing protein [Acidobacteriota bacterium]
MDDQLLQDFLSDAGDLVAALYDDIRALRERRGEGHARRALVERIFRNIHTFKGSAASAGQESATEIAHAFETLLDGVRLGRVSLDDAVLGALETALDAISTNLAAVRGEQTIVPRGLVERLCLPASNFATQLPASEAAAVFQSVPEDVARALDVYERQRLCEALQEGARLFVITVDFDLTNFDEHLRALQESLAERGEVVSTIPGINAAAPARISFRLIHASRENVEQIAARLSPFGATLLEAERANDDFTHAPSRTDSVGDDEADDARPDESHASASSPALRVRVATGEIDELISLARELTTETDGALDIARASAKDAAARDALEFGAARVRERLRELGGKLAGLRVVPLRQTLERAARAGESAARAAGREVEFEIAGGEVCLDRAVAEAVAAPLLHLLRNAVDHGIEPADERLRAGKPVRGRVRIEAVSEGNCVVLRVTDDGRGVDLERVAQVAAARGLLSPGKVLTEQQALRLIFKPGFSTAAEVSLLSGRGVGLDVVERAVEQAGGELRVTSVRGAGTTFELRFPAPPASF